MPHNLELLLTLAAGFTTALLFGLVTQRLKLSPLVGYLIAGVAIGPFTPGFVANAGLAEQLAEVGVILLMFGVGLHFHIKELLAVRAVALPGAIAQSAVAVGFGVLVTRPFGWSIEAGLVLGLAISVASTVVLLRVLSDFGALHTPAGHVAVGWLIVEDVFTVLVLVLMPALVGPDAAKDTAGVALSLGGALLKMTLLVAIALVFGQRLLPKLLEYIAKTRSRELFTLSVLVLALGLAVGSAKLFGASMALGAFLAGTIVGQSEFSSRAASDALPLRDAFAVLFFVSMGMLLDPRALLDHWKLILATLSVVLIAKPAIALVVVLALKRPPLTAVSVAIALAQIGEFSFILATLGRQLDVLPPEATQALVATAILSVTLNPLLYRLVPILAKALQSVVKRGLPDPLTPSRVDSAHQAVVVGYGPVGASLARILSDHEVQPTIVEMNLETVKRLRSEGMRVVYGDASHLSILEEAGAREAASLVFAASGTPPEAVIRAAKELNPDIIVIARSAYISEAPALHRAGAHVVVSAEAEVALSMAERILTSLGASRDQIDRARDRLHHVIEGAASPARP